MDKARPRAASVPAFDRAQFLFSKQRSFAMWHRKILKDVFADGVEFQRHCISASYNSSLVLYIMYSVGLNAPLKRGRRCFFHVFKKANAKANAPLKPERRAKSQFECPPNAPLNAPPVGPLLGTCFVKKMKKGGSRQVLKSSSKKHSKWVPNRGGYF